MEQHVHVLTNGIGELSGTKKQEYRYSCEEQAQTEAAIFYAWKFPFPFN